MAIGRNQSIYTDKEKVTGTCLIDHNSQSKQAVRLRFGSFCSLLTRASSKLQIWVYSVLPKKKAA